MNTERGYSVIDVRDCATRPPDFPPMQKSKLNSAPAASGAGADVSYSPPYEWIIAAIAIATLSLSYKVFSGQFLVSPHSDQYIAGYAFRDFAAQSLRSGLGFPQWNPYLFGGLPFVAAMHGDIFYPTFLLRLVMRTDLAMTWGFIIHMFLAGAFTLGFLRAMRFSSWASAFGALSYMLSGPIASYASPGHDGKLFVSALLPLGLWMLVRAIRDARYWAWGVFALTVGLAVLSPHPQLLQFMLLVSGAFALFLVWQHGLDVPSGAADARVVSGEAVSDTGAASHDAHRVPFDVRFVVTRLGAALAMVFVGAAIGAVQYWPVLGYVNVSPRADGRAYAFASQFSMPPEEMINMYLPQFSGILDSYWGRNGIHLHSEYLGVVVLMLAPLAFGSASRRALARFWLAVAVVSVLWALGEYTPFFHLVYYIIPGTRYFRAPSTMLYVTAFSVCMLSTLGFERVLSRDVSPRFMLRYAAGWGAFAILMLILSATGVFNAFALALGREISSAKGFDPTGFGNFIEQNKRAVGIGALRSLFSVAITSVALIAFTKQKLKLAPFAALVVVTCAVDFWTISSRYWIFSEPASALYRRDLITDYLREQKQPGRVFVYTKTADYRAMYDPYYGATGFGMGTGFMVHDIRSVTGYQGNAIARYEALAAGNGYINPAFWAHENVRWLYTNMEIADTVMTKVVGPIQNSAGSNAYLYRMPGDNPYSWVATKVAVLDDTSAGRAVLNSAYNMRSLAMFDPSSGIKGAPPRALPTPSTITTTVTKYGAGFADIQLSAPSLEGNTLLVSENFYPGWTATTDGKPLKVMRANYNIIGIPLPTGTRSVSLTFADPRYATGKIITWFALLGTAVLIGGGMGMRKREQRAVTA